MKDPFYQPDYYRSEASKRGAATTYKNLNRFNLPQVKGYIAVNKALKQHFDFEMYTKLMKIKESGIELRYIEETKLIHDIVYSVETNRIIDQYPAISMYLLQHGRNEFINYLIRIWHQFAETQSK